MRTYEFSPNVQTLNEHIFPSQNAFFGYSTAPSAAHLCTIVPTSKVTQKKKTQDGYLKTWSTSCLAVHNFVTDVELHILFFMYLKGYTDVC